MVESDSHKIGGLVHLSEEANRECNSYFDSQSQTKTRRGVACVEMPPIGGIMT